MSEYRFVSFVPVAGEWSGRGVLCRAKDRSEGDTWRHYPEDNFNPAEADMLEFIRPADSESPAAGPEIPCRLSLRDYFAGQALAGLSSNESNMEQKAGWLAQCSYLFADDMIEVRKAKRENLH